MIDKWLVTAPLDSTTVDLTLKEQKLWCWAVYYAMDTVPTLGRVSTYIMFFNLAEEREDELMKNSGQNFTTL